MINRPRGALPPGVLRQMYPHCIRRRQPEDGFDDLNRLHTWLRNTGYQCRTKQEIVGDAAYVSWCFATEGQAREFMLEFGGEPWTDHGDDSRRAPPIWSLGVGRGD